MKYLFQMLIIGGITFIGEVLNVVLPLPIPASVYGILFLFAALCLKIVKVEQIEETSDFLLLIMPVLFITPSVSLFDTFIEHSGSLFSLLFIAAVSTIAVMAVTGLCAQWMIRSKEKKKGNQYE